MRLNCPNILDALQEVLAEEDKRNSESVRLFRHNPSSASLKKENGEVVGACLRKLWYKAKNIPETDSREFSSKLVTEFGNALHFWLTEKLKKCSKLNIEAEVPGKIAVDPLTKEISFRLDGIVTYRGERGILEIKTGHGYALQKQLKEHGPKDTDILQCLSYLGTNPEVNWISLVYLSRDNGFRAEYHILREDDGTISVKGILPVKDAVKLKDMSFNGIVARWEELEKYVLADRKPPRDYKVLLRADGTVTEKRMKNSVTYTSDWQCLYCPYKTLCWSEPGAREDSKKYP